MTNPQPTDRRGAALGSYVQTAGSHVRRAVVRAERHDDPFRHWLLSNVLPVDLCDAVAALPFAAPTIGDTLGKRETHNASRQFVSVENRRRFPACATLAQTFQDEATVALFEDTCGTELAGSFLRIEYCLDADGFWLEPHTDIGAKLFTMLVYLSDHADAPEWGTDIMDASGQLISRSPGTFNSGLIFVPGADTWHGFAPRPIHGVRRSLIVNYVKPEWRARRELAFPETSV